MHVATEVDALVESCARALAEDNLLVAGLDVEDARPERFTPEALGDERRAALVVLRAAGVVPAE